MKLVELRVTIYYHLLFVTAAHKKESHYVFMQVWGVNQASDLLSHEPLPSPHCSQGVANTSMEWMEYRSHLARKIPERVGQLLGCKM